MNANSRLVQADGTRPRVGRPRADPRRLSKEPREELLDAAARLFSTHGYDKATTRAIAKAAGLRQPSMFHYFASKEELFAELLDRSVQPTLAIVERLAKIDAPADVRAYLLTYGDVYSLCSGPYNVPVLQLLPEARRPAFRAFWRKRRHLFDGYLDLLREVRSADAETATRVVFGAVESVATWFEPGRHDAAGVAESVADILLGGLVDGSRLEEVKAEAHRLLAEILPAAAPVAASP